MPCVLLLYRFEAGAIVVRARRLVKENQAAEGGVGVVVSVGESVSVLEFVSVGDWRGRIAWSVRRRLTAHAHAGLPRTRTRARTRTRPRTRLRLRDLRARLDLLLDLLQHPGLVVRPVKGVRLEDAG